MNEQRLIDLESKFSHQDLLIEELRLAVHTQYLQIEKLEKELKTLSAEAKSSDPSLITAHEKPPHY
ncbi:MAG: SlyX family protein [Pseudobdellovibrionaceae bacterium]